MNWADFRNAFNEAKKIQQIADEHVRDMASIVAGRLRQGNVHSGDLQKLKEELRDYNIHTGRWKEKS